MKQQITDVLTIGKTSTHQLGVKPPLIPCAEYTTLCHTICQQEPAVGVLLPSVAVIEGWSHYYKWLFLFMLDSGCRLSEALDIGPGNIDAFGSVLVFGKKGSLTRIVTPRLSSAYLLYAKSNNFNPFQDCKARTFQRLLINAGCYASFGNNSNNSVSHFFRHIHVLLRVTNGGDADLMQRFLGHKNVKSTLAYAKGVRGK